MLFNSSEYIFVYVLCGLPVNLFMTSLLFSLLLGYVVIIIIIIIITINCMDLHAWQNNMKLGYKP